jgi:homoserine dehydrogenase
LKLALIGFGSVGQGLVRLLIEKQAALAQQYGFAAQVTAVITRSRGNLYHPEGLDLSALLTAAEKGSFAGYPDSPDLRRDISAEGVAAAPYVDVVVEASPTDLRTGQPALDLCYTALEHGKHVVLANKGPVALDFVNLMERAKQCGRQVLFEGTVMSGTPALRLAREALAGAVVSQVRGILNGTTNYMLSLMEQGRAYDDVLAEAQRLGYAEADPTADVDGWDAAGKLLILASALFGRTFKLADLDVRGIRDLTPEDLRAAAADGMRYKLIAEASQAGGSVQPVKLPVSHPLAGVSGANNAVTFTTDVLGDVTLVGVGAGGLQTGFAVLSDLLALHRHA